VVLPPAITLPEPGTNVPLKLGSKPSKGIYLQAGRFSVEAKASRLCNTIRDAKLPAVYYEDKTKSSTTWVVLAGPLLPALMQMQPNLSAEHRYQQFHSAILSRLSWIHKNLPPCCASIMMSKTHILTSWCCFEMGDFYETFFEDAVTASKVLNITLTRAISRTTICAFGRLSPIMLWTTIWIN
jgi:hypothetical protein